MAGFLIISAIDHLRADSRDFRWRSTAPYEVARDPCALADWTTVFTMVLILIVLVCFMEQNRDDAPPRSPFFIPLANTLGLDMLWLSIVFADCLAGRP